MFGTFEAEKEEEKPVYGLVHNLETWNPLKSQFCQIEHIIKTAWTIEGWGNKLSVVFKGPGWSPGKPRLGLPGDIPEVESPEIKYDSIVPLWKSLYIWLHFMIILLLWHPYLGMNREKISSTVMLYNIVYITVSLGILGSLFNNRPNSQLPFIEAVRCGLFVILAHQLTALQMPYGNIVYKIYFISAVCWVLINLWCAYGRGKTTETCDKDTAPKKD